MDGSMMSSLGIMTLTRTPCELDKMSLFQDLKLKRRKVDSRCSSDGESVADTSTSSPDIISPSSPKMSEVIHNPPSPDSTPGRALKLEPPQDPMTSRLEESGVFDGGGGLERTCGGTSVIRALPVSRSHSPPVRPAPPTTPTQPPRPHSSPGRPANTSPVIAVTSPVIRHSPLIMSPPSTSSPLQYLQPTSPITHPSSSSRGLPGVITSQQATVIQSQLWLQNSRINGVKPELIGGNFSGGVLLGHTADIKPSPAHRATPAIRQTPTVIMGEAGGVRTMIWSQPPLNVAQGAALEPQMHATTSNWSSGSSSNSACGQNPEENAAQMLLHLGQERPRATTTRPMASVISPTTTLPSHFTNVPLNMERLWAGDLTQLPANQQMQALNLSSPTLTPSSIIYANRTDMKIAGIPETPTGQEAAEEEDQPMICMICEDKATGLHYGIITCEGCKGFFKRTVQNRRVYTCVADGNCEITKAQRNRCQYCRFKKCIEQGMVLQAVREDRMPGGRNSGAVYNLYKVKYKKHKKTTKQQAAATKQEKMMLSPQMKAEQPTTIPAHLVNGTILKTALTNPSEVVHLRQRLDSAVSSSRDRNYSIDYTLSMIQTLIDCDEFQDIATLQNLDDLLDHKSDLSEKLCQIELPVEVHTRLLTHKWHELLVLTTSAYQAIHGTSLKTTTDPNSSPTEPDFNQEVNNNLQTLQTCLTSMMGRPITMDQLRQDVGLMVEKITHVTLMFRRIKLTMEEYVCLKVITMLNQARPGVSGNSELENIQERYMTCLRAYTQHIYPQQPTRFQELLVRLPEVTIGSRFSCDGRPSGYYADVVSGCQVYHMCDGLGRQFSYACPNTTLFQQRMLICDHWYMVNCSRSETDFKANLLIGQNKPFVEDSARHPYHRTPRPDLLSQPTASEYNIVYRTVRTQYEDTSDLIGVDTDYDQNNGSSDVTSKPAYNLPSHWSTEYAPGGVTVPPVRRAPLIPALQDRSDSDFRTLQRPATGSNFNRQASSINRGLTQDSIEVFDKSREKFPSGKAISYDSNTNVLKPSKATNYFSRKENAPVNFKSLFKNTTPVFPTKEELGTTPSSAGELLEPPKASGAETDNKDVNVRSRFRATTPVFPTKEELGTTASSVDEILQPPKSSGGAPQDGVPVNFKSAFKNTTPVFPTREELGTTSSSVDEILQPPNAAKAEADEVPVGFKSIFKNTTPVFPTKEEVVTASSIPGDILRPPIAKPERGTVNAQPTQVGSRGKVSAKPEDVPAPSKFYQPPRFEPDHRVRDSATDSSSLVGSDKSTASVNSGDSVKEAGRRPSTEKSIKELRKIFAIPDYEFPLEVVSRPGYDGTVDSFQANPFVVDIIPRKHADA